MIHHYIDQGLTARRSSALYFSTVLSHYSFYLALTEQAINAPRIHDQIDPVGTTFEIAGGPPVNTPGYPNSTIAFLAALGHTVQYVGPGVSISSAIGHKNGTFDAASDPRIPGSGAVVV